MPNHLESKTMAGLAGILVTAVSLSLLGKLTPEMVDVLKYIGGFFFAVRLGANVSENMPGKK